MKKAVMFLIIAIMILSQSSLCFATITTLKDTDHLFKGGYNTDFGAQVWNIDTELAVTYSGTSSTSKTITKISTYASGARHIPEIGEGSYTFTRMKTYAGSTLLGSDLKSTFGIYGVIYPPTSYLYLSHQKTVSYTVPQSVSGKVVGDYYFNIAGWTPLLGTSWNNTLTCNIN
ncbi:MAG TPA: hypothetical protein VEA58_06765 [Anaerovoracaceae bacterium]|nr:hypothetical protein [Anaerovoracaceae bacterium]